MCTFSSILPRQSRANEKNKKRQMIISLNTCNDDADGSKTWYRFRLLNFTSKNSTREHPFIVRYVHQHWTKNDKGINELESEVVCPMTDWMEWDGDRFECPICKYANSQWSVLRESNYKDADARRKNREFGRIFQAIIPVYVVNDPNYEGNNGKFKVIIITDKEKYKEFYKKLEAQLAKNNCFNGVNASDICIHVSLVEHIINEGEANEYRWKAKEIDKIAFSKPYDLPAISRAAVDSFPFDEMFYQGSIKADIEVFKKRYIKVSNDDIIEEDDNVLESNKPVKRKVTPQNKQAEQKASKNDLLLMENDLASDPEDIDTTDIIDDSDFDDDLSESNDDSTGVSDIDELEDSNTESKSELDEDTDDLDNLLKDLF
jgi:hypothetical protein